MKKKLFLAVMLLVQVPLASAATVYNDEASFLTKLNPGYYLEEFSNYSYAIPLNGNQLTENYGPVNGYSWTASTIPNGVLPDTYGLFSLPNHLTTYAAEDLLNVTFTGKPVTALGGVFASTDANGNVIQQTVTVNLSDNTSVSLTGSGFRGFTSDFAITYLTIDGVDIPNSNWPQLGHFYVGSSSSSSSVAAVPVPGTVWLFCSGLLGLLLNLKRRANIG